MRNPNRNKSPHAGELYVTCVILYLILISVPETNGFAPVRSTTNKSSWSQLMAAADTPSADKKPMMEEEILGPLESVVDRKEIPDKAVTGTVNERLLQELEDEKEKEKYGARSGMGKKLGLQAFRSTKTEEEREAAIAEARNLNGVNPIVTTVGGLFALAVAAGLWLGTNTLAEFFALNPVDSELYFVIRGAAVFRNVSMGLVSLASGFFGVTGLGILLLGVRVGYGVAKGELDPTPIKRPKSDELEMPNVWELMTTTTPNRRRKK